MRSIARASFTGDRLPARENAIVLLNHQSAVDVNLVFSLAWRGGRLGDPKWFAKSSLRFLSGFGMSLYFLGLWEDKDRRLTRYAAERQLEAAA